MDVRESYNLWSSQYDEQANRTRDLEAVALRTILDSLNFKSCLEMGCGTGKNTVWLAEHASSILAVDLSENMLEIARQKVSQLNPSSKIEFVQADMMNAWSFTDLKYDLVVFSLVLEHISDINPIIQKAAEKLNKGGYLYIAELHPYKQYAGSKARFETEEGTCVVPCYSHHISVYTNAALSNKFSLSLFREWFHEGEEMPAIASFLFERC